MEMRNEQDWTLPIGDRAIGKVSDPKRVFRRIRFFGQVRPSTYLSYEPGKSGNFFIKPWLSPHTQQKGEQANWPPLCDELFGFYASHKDRWRVQRASLF